MGQAEREAERATAAVERSGTARLLRELGMPEEADKVERTPLYLFIERAWARDADEPAELDYGALGYPETELGQFDSMDGLAACMYFLVGGWSAGVGYELPTKIIQDPTDNG